MTTASDRSAGTASDRAAQLWAASGDASPTQGYGFKARHRFLRELCRGEGLSMLDAGCGTGADLRALAPYLHMGIGVDLDGSHIAEARAAASAGRIANLRFAIGDAIAFTLSDAAAPLFYDLILLADVLEQAADPRRVLAACRRRLAIGGRIVVIAVHRGRPGRWLIREGGADRGQHFTPAELRQIGRRAGLEAVACRALPWLPPRPEGRGRAAHLLLRALSRLPVPAFKGAFALVLQPALR
jgi:SAM-dependent methyltransferase